MDVGQVAGVLAGLDPHARVVDVAVLRVGAAVVVGVGEQQVVLGGVVDHRGHAHLLKLAHVDAGELAAPAIGVHVVRVVAVNGNVVLERVVEHQVLALGGRIAAHAQAVVVDAALGHRALVVVGALAPAQAVLVDHDVLVERGAASRGERELGGGVRVDEDRVVGGLVQVLHRRNLLVGEGTLARADVVAVGLVDGVGLAGVVDHGAELGGAGGLRLVGHHVVCGYALADGAAEVGPGLQVHRGVEADGGRILPVRLSGILVHLVLLRRGSLVDPHGEHGAARAVPVLLNLVVGHGVVGAHLDGAGDRHHALGQQVVPHALGVAQDGARNLVAVLVHRGGGQAAVGLAVGDEGALLHLGGVVHRGLARLVVDVVQDVEACGL